MVFIHSFLNYSLSSHNFYYSMRKEISLLIISEKYVRLSTNKYTTTHVSFLLRRAITVARTTVLPLASYKVFIFLGFVIQSLTAP